MSISEVTPQTASIVPEERRLDFLPTLFGRSLLMIGENAVYSLMERLSPSIIVAGSGNSTNMRANRFF